MTTRRTFLQGAAGALGLSGALAGSAAQAMPTERPKKFDEDYDVIVVGAGGAGLAAAAHAAEKGLRVLILEKMAFPGGSSAICGGGSLVVGTELQKRAGEKDSNELLFKDIIQTGGGLNNKDVVRTFVDNHLAVYNWFMGLGGKLQSDLLFSSVSANRGVEIEPNSVLQACLAQAKKFGAALYTKTAAKRLAFDGKTKRIVGVFAEKEGKTVSFGAKKGVILASGGFARNKALLAKYVPRMTNTLTICGKGCDGDGLKMALAYGADVADMPYIKATFAFNTDPHSINDSHYTYWEGGIVVNRAGKRFVNESIPKKDVGDYVLEQPGGIGYCVYDEPTRRISLKTARNNGSVLESEERGLVFKGNTVEEAAAKAGLDPKAVKETVERYNRDIREKGYDTVFGRKFLSGNMGELREIKEGPFYVLPSTAVLLATYCGVKINGKMQVVDVFGDVIPGLWASGEVAGGFHGRTYLSATAFISAVVFGWAAADDVLKA